MALSDFVIGEKDTLVSLNRASVLWDDLTVIYKHKQLPRYDGAQD